MLDLEAKARKIINQYQSNNGVKNDDLNSFCPNETTISDYLNKNLISFDSYVDLCNIISHTISGKVRINDDLILKFTRYNNEVKAELEKIPAI